MLFDKQDLRVLKTVNGELQTVNAKNDGVCSKEDLRFQHDFQEAFVVLVQSVEPRCTVL